MFTMFSCVLYVMRSCSFDFLFPCVSIFSTCAFFDYSVYSMCYAEVVDCVVVEVMFLYNGLYVFIPRCVFMHCCVFY